MGKMNKNKPNKINFILSILKIIHSGEYNPSGLNCEAFL